MVRYAAYRKRIQNEELFIRNIQHLNEQAENYRQQIKEISPNILADIESNIDDVKIYPFITKNEFDSKEFNTVKEFADKINSEKKTTNVNLIGDFLAKYAKSSIIDKNGNISEEWKVNIEHYPELQRANKEVEKCQKSLIEFQTNAENLLDKVHASVNESENFEQIQKFAIDKFTKTEENKKPRRFYFVILSLLGIFLLIAVVLCVLGVVL